MKQSYRVVIVMPQGYVHASCFIEVAHLLVSSLISLGIDCDIKLNDMAPDRVNILLGFHLLSFSDELKRYRYIPYQLEQLSDSEGVWSDKLRQLLENAHAVWDYSLENVAFLGAHGIHAHHLPVGYHENLELIPGNVDKEYDVLFFGSIGARRKPLLDRLTANPAIKQSIVFGAYGKQRDALIARSRVILNIHYYEARIFEAVRISYLLNNGCFVLTEESATNPYPAVELISAPYEELERLCELYACDHALRDKIRLNTYRQFKEGYSMVKLVQSVLS